MSDAGEIIAVFAVVAISLVASCCCCCCCLAGVKGPVLLGALAGGAVLATSNSRKRPSGRDQQYSETTSLVYAVPVSDDGLYHPPLPSAPATVSPYYNEDPEADASSAKEQRYQSSAAGAAGAARGLSTDAPGPSAPSGGQRRRIEALVPDPRQQSSWKDPWAGVLLLCNVALVITLAACKGGTALTDFYSFSVGDEQQRSEDEGRDDDYYYGERGGRYGEYAWWTVGVAVAAMAAMAALSVVLSWAWLVLLHYYASIATALPFIGTTAALATGAALALKSGAILWGVCLAAMAALMLMSTCGSGGGIRFAASNLRLGCSVLGSHPGLMLVPLAMVAVQVLWAAVWGLAVLGLSASHQPLRNSYMRSHWYTYYRYHCYEEYPDSRCENEHVVVFTLRQQSALVWGLVIASYLWGQQAMAALVQTTAAGVLGAWWLAPPPQSDHSTADGIVVTARKQEVHAVAPAFVRACSTSGGSVALGALAAYLAQAVAAVLRLMCCWRACFGPLLSYFNHYAYTYVGLFGLGFKEAGQKALDLFDTHGVRVVACDGIMSWCLSLGSVLLGVVVGALGTLAADPIHQHVIEMLDEDPRDHHPDDGDMKFMQAVLGVAGFMMGFSIASLFLRMVGGLADAAVVCFVEDPLALLSSHPHEFERARSAWASVCPGFASQALHRPPAYTAATTTQVI